MVHMTEVHSSVEVHATLKVGMEGGCGQRGGVLVEVEVRMTDDTQVQVRMRVKF